MNPQADLDNVAAFKRLLGALKRIGEMDNFKKEYKK